MSTPQVLFIVVEVHTALPDELSAVERLERAMDALQHLLDSRRRHGTKYTVKGVIDATARETPND